MEVEKDKIKDLFSSKLGGFEPEVPASLWGGLDQLLSNQPVPQADASSSSSSSTSTTGNASLIKTIAIIVGLAVAVAAGVFFLSSEKDIVEEPKVEKVKEIISDTVPAEEKDSVYEVPVVSFKQPAVREQQLKEDKVVIPEEEIGPSDIEEEKQEEIKEEYKEEIVKTEPIVELPVVKLEKKGKGISIGVVADMGLLSYQNQGVGADLLFSRKERSKDFIEALDAEGSEIVMKHKRPITVGLTIGKALSSKLSFETGLMYSYLSSEVSSDSEFDISETRNFSYIGIPLSLNYTLGEFGKTKFYWSLGGMIQKDIRGEYISYLGIAKPDIIGAGEDELYYKEAYYIKKSIKQSNPQFSLRTTLGVMHPLYKKLYIYGAIGGVYYFDSNNKYRTIYSDKKTQLNLNIGVKYDF